MPSGVRYAPALLLFTAFVLLLPSYGSYSVEVKCAAGCRLLGMVKAVPSGGSVRVKWIPPVLRFQRSRMSRSRCRLAGTAPWRDLTGLSVPSRGSLQSNVVQFRPPRQLTLTVQPPLPVDDSHWTRCTSPVHVVKEIPRASRLFSTFLQAGYTVVVDGCRRDVRYLYVGLPEWSRFHRVNDVRVLDVSLYRRSGRLRLPSELLAR